jgi:alanine racemase
MDLTTIDVTAVGGAEVGDEAVVLGAQGDAIIDAEEIADAAGTIPYEILTNVSRRVPRVYL